MPRPPLTTPTQLEEDQKHIAAVQTLRQAFTKVRSSTRTLADFHVPLHLIPSGYMTSTYINGLV